MWELKASNNLKIYAIYVPCTVYLEMSSEMLVDILPFTSNLVPSKHGAIPQN